MVSQKLFHRTSRKNDIEQKIPSEGTADLDSARSTPVKGPSGAEELDSYYLLGSKQILNLHAAYTGHLSVRLFPLRLLRWATIYITLVILFGLMSFYLRPHGIGLTLLGILPSALHLCFLQQSYRQYVLKSQMAWIFFVTVWWMCIISEYSSVATLLASLAILCA